MWLSNDNLGFSFFLLLCVHDDHSINKAAVSIRFILAELGLWELSGTFTRVIFTLHLTETFCAHFVSTMKVGFSSLLTLDMSELIAKINHGCMLSDKEQRSSGAVITYTMQKYSVMEIIFVSATVISSV